MHVSHSTRITFARRRRKKNEFDCQANVKSTQSKIITTVVLLHKGCAKLTTDQKKELASKRLKHGHKPGAAKDSKTKSGGKPKDVIKNLRAVNRQVSQLVKQMIRTTVDEQSTVTGSSNSSSMSEKATKKARTGTNRTNGRCTHASEESFNCRVEVIPGLLSHPSRVGIT